MPTVRGCETDSPKLLLEDIEPDAVSEGGAGDSWRERGGLLGVNFKHKSHKKTKQKTRKTKTQANDLI